MNFAARVLTCHRKFDHVSDVIRDAGWFSAADLIQYHRLMVVYRLLCHHVPETLANTIGRPANERHQRNTRGASQLVLPNVGPKPAENGFVLALSLKRTWCIPLREHSVSQ